MTKLEELEQRIAALEAVDAEAKATLEKLVKAVGQKQIEMPAWLKMTALVDRLDDRVAALETAAKARGLPSSEVQKGLGHDGRWPQVRRSVPLTTPDEAMAAAAEIQNEKCVACGQPRKNHLAGISHEFVDEYAAWYLCPLHHLVVGKACCEAARRQEPKKHREPRVEPLPRDESLWSLGTPEGRKALDEMLQHTYPPKALVELSDATLLTRAVDFLDGPGSDARGTITYTGGPNEGETHPTQEAEMLASEFKRIRDKVIDSAVRLAVPFQHDKPYGLPDVFTKRDRLPTVVCLCGSTRFSKAFADANLAETLAGRIVLTVGSMTHSDAQVKACIYCGQFDGSIVTDLCTAHLDAADSGNAHAFQPLTATGHLGTKQKLDALHFKKIEMADEILVLNVKRSRGSCGCIEPHGGIPDECVHGFPMAPYIGESTRGEIEHALRLKKHIRFLNPQGRALTTALLYSPGKHEPTVEEQMELLGLGARRTDVRRNAVPVNCSTCINRCMDMTMDPYCAAVNKPFGQTLTKPRPKECAGADGEQYLLWERDTRGHRGGG